MKNRHNKQISLKKLTIARITSSAMYSIKGGSTELPTVTDAEKGDTRSLLASHLCDSTLP